jgi:hypothetical protein
VQVRKYAIGGMAAHLAGLALGIISIALVLRGRTDIESGLAVITPFADALYGLGIVMVVAVASRAGVPMKYLVITGAVIGVGLFYKSAPHEFLIASGIGFGLVHNAHLVLGNILIAVSVVAIAALALVYNRSKLRGEPGR